MSTDHTDLKQMFYKCTDIQRHCEYISKVSSEIGNSHNDQYSITNGVTASIPKGIVIPLVLQVYFSDHTGSLNNPNLQIQSGITNCHSYFRVGSCCIYGLSPVVWLQLG